MDGVDQRLARQAVGSVIDSDDNRINEQLAQYSFQMLYLSLIHILRAGGSGSENGTGRPQGKVGETVIFCDETGNARLRLSHGGPSGFLAVGG